MLQPIVEETVVDAPRAELFRTFTTTEGVTTFMARDACVELAPEGPYEVYFDLSAGEGLRGSEGCRVLSWVEDEMVSFSWNAPPSFPDERGQRTFVVVQLSDSTEGGTRVRVTHGGWRDGDGWAAVRAYFEKAWLRVLENLRERFRTGPLWEREDTNRVTPPELTEFAYLVRPVREGFFESPTDEENELVTRHAEYVRDLLARDRLELAARGLEPAEAPASGDALEAPVPGMVLFRAESLEAAREVMDGDPAIAGGFFRACVFAARIPFRRP